MVTGAYVNGLAWNTALGCGLEEVWNALMAGRSGLRAVAAEPLLRNSLVATCEDFALGAPPERRIHRLAVDVVSRALRDARVDPGARDLQLILGTSLGSWIDESAGGEPPHLPKWVDDVAAELGLYAPPIALATACSAGADALLVGLELIESGAAETCVCGGVDVLTLSKRMAHSALGTMSPTLLRAFDQRHDGMLLGEGGAALVLRGVPGDRGAYALLLGAGSANDAFALTAPDTNAIGARLAIERCLAACRVKPEDVGTINAHASGTALNDAAEIEAFRRVFGDSPEGPVVWGTKGNFGHSLGATGAIEAVATILALRAGRVPPVFELSTPVAGFPLPLAMGDGRLIDAKLGLSITLGFGGFDTCLAFKTPSVEFAIRGDAE